MAVGNSLAPGTRGHGWSGRRRFGRLLIDVVISRLSGRAFAGTLHERGHAVPVPCTSGSSRDVLESVRIALAPNRQRTTRAPR